MYSTRLCTSAGLDGEGTFFIATPEVDKGISTVLLPLAEYQILADDLHDRTVQRSVDMCHMQHEVYEEQGSGIHTNLSVLVEDCLSRLHHALSINMNLLCHLERHVTSENAPIDTLHPQVNPRQVTFIKPHNK
jgi:hypothetical protein